MTYGNAPYKIQVDEHIEIQECNAQDIPADVPPTLPMHPLTSILEATKTCVVSTKGIIKQPGSVKTVSTAKGDKEVTNFTVMADGRDIEVSAWGKLAQEMSGQPAETAYCHHTYKFSWL